MVMSSSHAISVDAVLAEHAAAIRTLGRRIVSDVAEIGRHLIEVKRIAATAVG